MTASGKAWVILATMPAFIALPACATPPPKPGEASVSERVIVTSPAQLLALPNGDRLATLPAGFSLIADSCTDGWLKVEARPGGKVMTGYLEANRTTWQGSCD